MADTIIQLPYTATTSGDQLDASSLSVGGVTVKRERLVIGNDTSSHVATVSSSGALRTIADVSGSFPLIVSGSVTANLSSATSLSSGTVTLSSNPTVISASSGFVQVYQSTSPWAISGTVLSASSGLVQVLQSTGPWAVTGGGSTAVTLIGSTGTTAIVSSGGALTVSVVSSGGIYAPVTSSAGLIVTLATGAGSGGAGSTAINLPTVSAAGFAPVTSSYGLQANHRTTGRTFGTIVTTVGAPLLQILTTAQLWLYSITFSSTGSSIAGQAIAVHSATSALSTDPPKLRLTNATVIFQQQVIFPSGVLFANGLSALCSLGFLSTTSNTGGPFNLSCEYEI